ncbi:glycosyl transferase [Bacillus coahuilensis p1.1.43]|uniref:Glycosyl transferase n=1 Tax=Bacillus coahuilensis p1.1.43 TaxID=1150625 RepID=A0A147K592_9BACI|nr:glycosyl transferase [Bacillus coahuilensis p1.1.43]
MRSSSKVPDSSILAETGGELFPVSENIRTILDDALPQNYNFCTISGKEYVVKVLALYQSLERHTDQFTLFICCIDNFTYELLKKMNLSKAVLFMVEEIETEEMRKLRQERKKNEYCWTLKAPLVEFLLTHANIDSILYCDGDLYFFSDPAPIYKEWGNKSIYLCPQRDLEWVEAKYGKFQAGLIGFKNDSIGLQGVRWWKQKCFEWCSANPDATRFGDQKYLDSIPMFLTKVKVSKDLGINAAPWNCIYNNDYTISKQNDKVYIENDPLVVFHFACLAILNRNEFDLWSLNYIPIQETIKNNIYIPYLEHLSFIIDSIQIEDSYSHSLLFDYRDPNDMPKTYYKNSALQREIDRHKEFLNITTIVSQEYVLKAIALYSSLVEKGENFRLWVCCMDTNTFNLFASLHLEHVTLISLRDVETDELRLVKKDRNIKEYCWTIKAPLCEYVLKNYPEIKHIVYCDADMYFFSGYETLLNEWGTYSIFMCKQRGTSELESIHGQYQAGLIGFKREKNALSILTWWKEKCLENCSEIPDSYYDSWGDQKYLNSIPRLFSNIKIIENIGINTAPWNLIMNNHYEVSRSKGKVLISDTELVSYHFGSLSILGKREFDLWNREPLNINESIIRTIYIPYLQKLLHAGAMILEMNPSIELSSFYSTKPIGTGPKNYYVFNSSGE